jgi:hemoglobin-like flavoprotein
MSIQLSDQTRSLLAQSLPLMERGKDGLIDGFGAYLRAAAPETGNDPELVAMMLTEMLITQTAQLLACGTLQDAGDLNQEHRALDIEGRHYSRFGDALSPVIRDVLGPNVPRALVAAWGDAFWAIIRTVQSARRPSSHETGQSGVLPDLRRAPVSSNNLAVKWR